MSDQTPDAVAQAERELDLAAAALAKGLNATLADSERYINARRAYAAAVRAECAAKRMGLSILDQSGNIICCNVEGGCAWEIVDALDAAFPTEAPHSLWNYTVGGHWKVERNANTAEAQP